MHSTQFCVSGRRPIAEYLYPICFPITYLCTCCEGCQTKPKQYKSPCLADGRHFSKNVFIITFTEFEIAHDDVIKWELFALYWPFVKVIPRWPVDSPCQGQWRGALVFSLIWAWTNGWANTCDAGDLRRHRAYYDVTCDVLHVIGPFAHQSNQFVFPPHTICVSILWLDDILVITLFFYNSTTLRRLVVLHYAF